MKDVLITFALACAASLATIVARYGWQISREPPPEDSASFSAWRRKWLWMVAGEVLTVPAFGSAWTAAVSHYSLGTPATVAGAMMLGAFGFGFWADAAQRIVSRRLENV